MIHYVDALDGICGGFIKVFAKNSNIYFCNVVLVIQVVKKVDLFFEMGIIVIIENNEGILKIGEDIEVKIIENLKKEVIF